MRNSLQWLAWVHLLGGTAVGLASAATAEPVLVHRFESLRTLQTAPAGASVTAKGAAGVEDAQRGRVADLPGDGGTVTIDLPRGLPATGGTVALWFKVFDHPKWQLETTPLLRLIDAEGRTVHVIRRTLATEHYGRDGQFGYTQTADAFTLLPDTWRHACLVWDADAAEAASPRGVVRFYVDGRPTGAYYLDLPDAPIVRLVLGGPACRSRVDDLVAFARPLIREAVRQLETIDATLPARVAAAGGDWGPGSVALLGRDDRIRRAVRDPRAIVIEAERKAVGEREVPLWTKAIWRKPDPDDGPVVKDAYARDENGRVKMAVQMAVPKEWHSQAHVASGNAYRAMTHPRPVTWAFDVPADGEYAVLLRYAIARELHAFRPEATRRYAWSVRIDGGDPFSDAGAHTARLPQTGNGYDPFNGDVRPLKYWALAGGRKVRLAAGRHTITVRNAHGRTTSRCTYTDDKTDALDCLVLTPADVANPTHPEHLADYQRTPQMWVESCRTGRAADRTKWTYTVHVRSRSDAPATYALRLDTTNLVAQTAELRRGPRTLALDPGGQQTLEIAFTAAAGYQGAERCLVRLWQLENRTRFDWWMFHAVPGVRTGVWPRREGLGQGRYDQANADRLAAMSEQQLRALVPYWPHSSFGGAGERARKLLEDLGAAARAMDPDALTEARKRTDDPWLLMNVRGQRAGEVWAYHGGKGGSIRDLVRAYAQTGQARYARAVHALWMEVCRSYSRRVPYAYTNEYRADMHPMWGDPWGSYYPRGFGFSAQMKQVVTYGNLLWGSGRFSETDRLQIHHNLLLRAARLAMNGGRRDDLSYASVGGQMGWQQMPELAEVCGNPWFRGEYVQCIKSNLKGFASDGVDTSNWISSYGGAYGSAVQGLKKLGDLRRVLDKDPQFAATLHRVCVAWPRAAMSNGMPAADHDGGPFGWLGQIPWGWGDYGPETLEFARDVFGDTRAGDLIRHAEACAKTGRILDEDRTVAWLDKVLPSVVFPDTGVAVLHNRSGSGDPRDWIELYVDYGQSGGPHGHPAKLHVLLFGHGVLLSRDLNYGARPHMPVCWAWAKRALSHNTVVSDGRAPGAPGTLRAFVDLPGLKVLDVASDHAWALGPGDPDSFASRRVIFLAGEYYLDLFRVSAPRPRPYAWLWRSWGDVDIPGSARAGPKLRGISPWEGLYVAEGERPVLIDRIVARRADETWQARWDFTDPALRAEARKAGGEPKARDPWQGLEEGERLGLRIVQLGHAGGLVEGARVPAIHFKTLVRNAQVVSSRRAKATVFATVFETFRRTAGIESFEALPVRLGNRPAAQHEALAVRVRLAGGVEDVVLVNFTGGQAAVRAAGIVTDAVHLAVRHKAGRAVRAWAAGGKAVTVAGRTVPIRTAGGQVLRLAD